MKIIDGFVVRTVAGKCVAVAVGKQAREKGAMISLNEAGRDIFELLQKEDLTEEEVAHRLETIYDAPYDTLLSDAKEFVGKLRDAGLLVEG